MRTSLIACIAVLLSGCWVPPSASVQPGGNPRVVRSGIPVEWNAGSARVESVDPATRTLVLRVHGIGQPTCRIGRRVGNWGALHRGDRLRATIREMLTVYVAPEVESGAPDRGTRREPPHAHVLAVDPSYRLLTVQYPHGGTQTFKIGLHIPMRGIEPGDTVAFHQVEVVALHLLRRASSRPGTSRSSRGAT